MSEANQSTNTSGIKFRRYVKIFALGLLVLFAIAPVILAALPFRTANNTFSIYNSGYDGYSLIRSDLESIQDGSGPKYEPLNIISNLNVLNRFNGSGALVIAGPAGNFDVTETIAVVLYLLRGGSVIIADDFGTGNGILDPIFSAFENMAKFSEEAENLGFAVPDASNIFSGGTGSSSGGNDTGGSSVDPADFLEGGDSEVAQDIGDSFMTDLIGDVITRFAINTSSVLMDVGSNNQSPVRPIVTEIDHTELQFGNDKYTYTQNVNRIQMEFASSISVKVKTTDADGNEVQKWQPLQKISTALISGGEDGLEMDLPFFPMYSSKNSWLESNLDQAADGTAEPDIGEWGNAKFALGLTIPLFPGFGKLIFIADPSIFINRWTSDVTNNDNLLLFRNLIDMATFTQEVTFDADGTRNPIPIIFDFGHTYQSFTSPALYSTALMKLIAQISMFPFYAPFVPLAAYGYGKRLMPESRRLRPILLTKKRGEKGHSEFERKLEDIKLSDGYGEPILHLTNRLVREVQSDVRFTGSFAKNPKEMAQFFADNFPGFFSRRELQSQLTIIFRIAENPTRRITQFIAKRHLQLLKKLIDLIS